MSFAMFDSLQLLMLIISLKEEFLFLQGAEKADGNMQESRNPNI